MADACINVLLQITKIMNMHFKIRIFYLSYLHLNPLFDDSLWLCYCVQAYQANIHYSDPSYSNQNQNLDLRANFHFHSWVHLVCLWNQILQTYLWYSCHLLTASYCIGQGKLDYYECFCLVTCFGLLGQMIMIHLFHLNFFLLIWFNIDQVFIFILLLNYETC